MWSKADPRLVSDPPNEIKDLDLALAHLLQELLKDDSDLMMQVREVTNSHWRMRRANANQKDLVHVLPYLYRR